MNPELRPSLSSHRFDLPRPGTRFCLGCCLVLAALSACGQSLSLKGKKLLEFGWDEPGTVFLRTHISELQQTPFAGCVFHVDYHKADGSQGSFTWQGWGTNAFVPGDVAGAMLDLRTVRFGRFNQCFLRFNTTPGRLDWFDDYGAVLRNAELAAQLARAGRCRGILFDIEQYEGPLFEYHKQRHAGSKSWELYARQARRRGFEVMQAFQKGYPHLTVFLTFGYSLPWNETSAGRKPLADCRYGLLAPFLDGMVEAARARTRLIDGYEISYGYKAAAQFASARQAVTQDLLPIVRDPNKYRKVFSLAFGVWLDRDWRKAGWNVEEPQKNYFSPDAFTTAVRAALESADEYVWIYSETPRWWSEEGKPVKLPPEYGAALRLALSPISVPAGSR